MKSPVRKGKKIGSFSIDVDTLEADLSKGCRKERNNVTADLSEISYRRFLPRYLELCDRHNVKTTFFIVGKHALNSGNRRVIRQMAENGHEIANHTLNHIKHFAHLNREEIEQEITESDKILSDITGRPVVGFKAPGFVVNRNVFDVLVKRGYTYDASLLPSFVYNVLKLFLKVSYFSDDINIQNLKLCFASITPFHPDSNDVSKEDTAARFLEIPVNVLPLIRFPFVNYIFAYFNYRFMNICSHIVSRSRQTLNYSFHDLEFADASDFQGDDDLMSLFLFTRRIVSTGWDERKDKVDGIFSFFSKEYHLVPLKTLAEHLNE